MDTPSFIELLKQLRFPTGSGTIITNQGARWTKQRGQAGHKVLSRVREAALEAGFTSGTGATLLDATGDRHARSGEYRHEVEGCIITLSLSSFYGQTAADNRFTIDLDVKNSQ